jgi:hypothetical protein
MLARPNGMKTGNLSRFGEIDDCIQLRDRVIVVVQRSAIAGFSPNLII